MNNPEKCVAVLKPTVGITRTLSLLFAIFFLNGCGRNHDPALQKKLPGTWTMQATFVDGGTFQSTINYTADGNYSGKVVTHSVSNTLRTAELEGTWEIKDGVLIDTMIKNSMTTNADLHFISHERIIRLDDQELRTKFEQKIEGVVYPTNDSIFRRVGK